MRIGCATVDDFFTCLDAEVQIFQSTIRLTVSPHPIGEPTIGKVPTKVAIILQATALVSCEGNAEYLLEVGVDCGMDYNDASQEKKGTPVAEALKARFAEYAAKRGWRILPGVIGE